MVKVSVVIPVYNVEKYLKQCLDSIANQTLKEIEVICVNDGSNDASYDIIMEYVNRDPRFKVIDKKNSGYGASMNRGFDMACGEYIGIVESDDFIEPNMLKSLYDCAAANDLDVCKGGFYYYYSAPVEKNIGCYLPKRAIRKGVFCPTTDFKSLREQIEFFNIKPTIWSAIYKKDFIRENNIRFTETPGASFQDTAFNFMVWALAKRVKLLNECFLHYRQDNEGSSINSGTKVFCVCDEYAKIESFLDENPALKKELEPVKNALKYNTYIWNYERLTEEKAGKFIIAAAHEFKRDMECGGCKREAYPAHKWNNLKLIIENPLLFHQQRQAEKKDEAPYVEGEEQGNALKRAFCNIKKNGIKHTFRKLRKRLGK